MRPNAPPLTAPLDPRHAFEDCLARLRARGLDAEAIAAKAAVNLQHWRDHPAPWDDGFVPEGDD